MSPMAREPCGGIACLSLAGRPYIVSIGCLSASWLTETEMSFPCLLVLSVWPEHVTAPVVLWHLVNVLSAPGGCPEAFPVCGCKITTKNPPVQVFLCFRAYFSEIFLTTGCQLD